MMLAALEWLLLLPALAVAAWLWPWLGLHRWRRVALLALLVVVLARPMMRLAGDGIDLWVLADRSASAAAALRTGLPEWEALLQRAQGRDDRLRIVDFAAAPVLREAGDNAALDALETRTALALQFVLGQLEKDRLARILLLSDGYATEPLTAVAEPLVKSGAPLDFRLLVPKPGADFRAASIDAPQRVPLGEAALFDARVVGSVDATFE